MSAAARHYAIVTAAYWGFTLTDGALRMLVLLHFFRLGYSPFTLAFLFLLYEAAGIAANLLGGWLAVRYGITRMLAVGLATQIAGFLLLSGLSPGWTAAASVAWVVLAQGVCGVAKDLTKTASKSAIKIAEAAARSEDAKGRLFRWVAWFTGSKNAMKGVGFFLGGLDDKARLFRDRSRKDRVRQDAQGKHDKHRREDRADDLVELKRVHSLETPLRPAFDSAA